MANFGKLTQGCPWQWLGIMLEDYSLLADCSSLVEELALVVNLVIIFGVCPLVAYLGRLLWECLLVSDVSNMAQDCSPGGQFDYHFYTVTG